MAVEIYSTPNELTIPVLGGITSKNINSKIKAHDAAVAKYVEDLKEWLTSKGYTGKNAGEILRFPVADGYAQYMVISMKPLSMFHLELDDAWQFQYAHLLTAKEINEKIKQQEALAKAFS